jgi:hypothetical protein
MPISIANSVNRPSSIYLNDDENLQILLSK